MSGDDGGSERRLPLQNPDEKEEGDSFRRGITAGAPFSRLSEASIHSFQWWRLLERSSSTESLPESKTVRNPIRRLFHSYKVYSRLATWQTTAFFAICWLVLAGAAAFATVLWARNVESSRRSQATQTAEELAGFLGREIEQFFVPLYPLRLFVDQTRLIHLSRIAAAFPKQQENLGFRDISSLADHPEVSEDFEDVMEGIWKSVEPHVREAIISIQLSPRGVVSMVSPLEGNEVALGLDLFLDRNRAHYGQFLAAAGRAGPSVIGPTQLLQGAVGCLAYLPVYVGEHVDGAMATTEMEGVEKQVVEGMKLWGFAAAAVNLTAMSEWSGAVRDSEYADMRFMLFDDTPIQSTDDFVVTVNVSRIHWQLSVVSVRGFWPRWFWPSCVAAVVGAGLVASLVSILLLSRKKHRMLLYRIMPRDVVQRLHQGRQVVQTFDTATVFFSDLVGFTDLSSRRSPLEVVALLNDLYTEFDKLARRHQVFKSDTIGDAYMVVGGAPEQCGEVEGAERVARFALAALEVIEDKNVGLAMRAGMASGPVVAAVVGTAVPKYSFFGETVHTANVMESTSRAGKLQVTEATKLLLEQSGLQLSMPEAHDGMAARAPGDVKAFWVRREGGTPQLQPQPERRLSLRLVSPAVEGGAAPRDTQDGEEGHG